MRILLEWLRPGVKIKRYIILQLVSISSLIYAISTLVTRENMAFRTLIAYIALITIALFLTIYSFILAQRSVLMATLKGMAYKGKNVDVRRLLYTESVLKKGPKVVIIGGGKGLSNILSGLKEYTSNITSIVSTFDDGGSTGKLMEQMDILPPGDIRKSIIALSESGPVMESLLTYRFSDGKVDNHSLGNLFIAALSEITGSFPEAIHKMADIFNVRGKILPVTIGKAKLCAGLENGEIVVGENNIRPRVIESKSKIKQIFLKDSEVMPADGVIESIRNADVVVIGPGSLYTSVACNFLVNDLGKAIMQTKAKKIFISNIMNEPGETLGYTLAKHVNEIERYIGKHVIDYCLCNNGEITKEMIKDFNQGASTPVTMDLENIQNRAISIIQEDFVVTAPNAILHDNHRVAEIIIEIAKRKKGGKLNLLKIKKKHKVVAKKLSKEKEPKKVIKSIDDVNISEITAKKHKEAIKKAEAKVASKKSSTAKPKTQIAAKKAVKVDTSKNDEVKNEVKKITQKVKKENNK